MLPSLRSLQAFEAVARHRSFTSAADELGVSQPAVSLQVRNLEAFLKAQLISRDARTLTLTPIGRTLYNDLSKGLDIVRQSVAFAQGEIQESPLGVFLKPHFAMKWLTPRLPLFSAIYPGQVIHFIHSNGPADLNDESIHISIEFRRFDNTDQFCRLLFPGNLTPAVSPSLLNGSHPIKVPKDLENHRLLHESTERTWPEWLGVAGVPGLKPAGREFYDDTNVRQEAAIAGEGVVLVCPRLVEDDISKGRLVCPFDISIDSFSYYLRISPHAKERRSVRLFANWLFDQASKDIV